MLQTGLNWVRWDFFAKVSDLHLDRLQLTQFLADQVLKCSTEKSDWSSFFFFSYNHCNV